MDSVLACREPDLRGRVRLTSVPHVIEFALMDDGASINELFPSAVARCKYDDRLLPVNAVDAFGISHRMFRTP